MASQIITMQEIEEIYRNTFGISFFWKKGQKSNSEKVQVIFRDTGFCLSRAQLKDFVKKADKALGQARCQECECGGECRSFLLRTPAEQVDMAISRNELFDVKDLLEGTLFQLNLNNYLKQLCNN